MRIRTVSATMVAILSIGLGAAAQQSAITIVANPGRFGDVEAAATAELDINWWDADTAGDTACTECFAATELRRYLARCTDVAEADITLAAPDAAVWEGYVIVLGTRASNPLIPKLDPQGEHKAPDAAESFAWRCFAKDAATVCVIEGADRSGVLYGAMDYLNRLGMRFYGLGEQGTVYPDTPVELPSDASASASPSYITRGFWAWEDRGNDDFFRWMAHNRLNLWTSAEEEAHFCKKLGMKLTEGGHRIQKWFLDPAAEYPYNHPIFAGDEDKPADPYAAPPGNEYVGDTDEDGKLTYFEAHPEWYGLYEGKRRADIGGDFGTCNFCSSNGDAVTELARNMATALENGHLTHTDVLNVWMLDNGKWCQCEHCLAQGRRSDRLLRYIHRLQQELAKAQAEGRLSRNVELASLAYHETLEPPANPLPEGFDYGNMYMTFFPIERTYTHAFADPASTEVNQHLLTNYQGWVTGENRNYQGAMCIGEYYNVSSIKALPALYPRIMAVDIPWYHRNGARHFHYMHTPARLWGTWTLNQYLMARLLWDVDADAYKEVQTYFDRYYADVSDQARAFYAHLEQATSNIKAYKHYVWGYSLRNNLNRRTDPLFKLDLLRYGRHECYLDDGLDVAEMLAEMDRARAALDAATAAAGDGKVKARLAEDERRFAYGEAMYGFYHHMVLITQHHNAGETEKARAEWPEVQRLAGVLENITDLANVAGSHGGSPNGLEASQITRAYGFMKKTYGEE